MHILDVTKNVALETLEASNTALTDIDLSKNLEMRNLNLAGCSSMHILDVSKNVALETLDVSLLVKRIVSKGLNPSIYKVGQYVSIDDVLGVVFYNTDVVVKIVSNDETANTQDAAITWCKAKGTAWYLPDENELKAVYNNKAKLNATLSSTSVGSTQLGTNYYWSSTRYITGACYVDFSSGSTTRGNKDNTYSVRAVRAL